MGDDIKQAVDDVLREMPTRELVERTVAATEARIVAWLREKSSAHHSLAVKAKAAKDSELASTHISISHTYSCAATAIERREHEETAGGE